MTEAAQENVLVILLGKNGQLLYCSVYIIVVKHVGRYYKNGFSIIEQEENIKNLAERTSHYKWINQLGKELYGRKTSTL